MPSVADICNMALSHIGSDTVVASISPPDGSVEAGHCARFYPIARKEALQSGAWTWTKTRTLLAQVTNPSDVWLYAYALPSDCVDAKRVLRRAYAFDFIVWPFTPFIYADELSLWTERGSADFEIEGNTILTNEPEAVLLYTRDITDTTKFSDMFVVYLSYLLAAYLAGPIIKGQAGAQTSSEFRQAAKRMLGEAASSDANQSAERAGHVPDFIRAR